MNTEQTRPISNESEELLKIAIFSLSLWPVTWYGKNVTFTDFLEIHRSPRYWPVKPIWNIKTRVWDEKVQLDSLVPILDNFLTLVPSHGPRPNERTSRRPIILKLCRVITGMNTEQTRPISSESEQFLKIAIFSLSLWPVTWYGKNVTFTDFLEIHRSPRYWPVKPIWYIKTRVWDEKVQLDSLVPILDNFLTLVPSHGPRPN